MGSGLGGGEQRKEKAGRTRGARGESNIHHTARYSAEENEHAEGEGVWGVHQPKLLQVAKMALLDRLRQRLQTNDADLVAYL